MFDDVSHVEKTGHFSAERGRSFSMNRGEIL